MTMFIIFVIYLYTRSDYDAIFEAQPKLVPKAWFVRLLAALRSLRNCFG